MGTRFPAMSRLAKPDPAIYSLVLKKIGRPRSAMPARSMTLRRILRLPRQLGFETILFRSPEQLGVELLKLGLYTIKIGRVKMQFWRSMRLHSPYSPITVRLISCLLSNHSRPPRAAVSVTAKPLLPRESPASKAASRPSAPPEPSFWESLSPERKLDVIGIVLAVAGILILLTLLASSRSASPAG